MESYLNSIIYLIKGDIRTTIVELTAYPSGAHEFTPGFQWG